MTDRHGLPANVAGLVFDLDGTLIDSYGAIAESLNHARALFGLPPLDGQTVRDHVGRGLEALIGDLVGHRHVAEGVTAFRERYAEVYAEATVTLPGVPATLARLAAVGIRMSVASNKPARFGRPILENCGLAGHFDVVHGPDTAGATKPDPAMIHGCLEAMQVRGAEALYVGDMPLDVVSADRAGLPVLLVPTGSADAAELEATGRPVLDRISDLPDILQA